MPSDSTPQEVGSNSNELWLPSKTSQPCAGIFYLLGQNTNLRQRFSQGKYRSRRFGGARTRAKALSEHAAAEKDEVRYPVWSFAMISTWIYSLPGWLR